MKINTEKVDEVNQNSSENGIEIINFWELK